MLDGEGQGAQITLADRPSYSIGRAEESDLQLRDRSVSRLHSRVEFDGDYFWLVDCGSANGTRVNEDLVHRYMLHDGDVIRIGRVNVRFHLASGSEGA